MTVESGESTGEAALQAVPQAAIAPAPPTTSDKKGPAENNVTGTAKGSKDEAHPRPPRRKKASRACYHCQKAHLTCDDSRPCQRCIRKGLADQCVDGYRKKAKYLLEEDEIPSTMPHPLRRDMPPRPVDTYAPNMQEKHRLSNPTTGYANPAVFEHTSSRTFPRTDVGTLTRLARVGAAPPATFDSNTAFGFDPTSLESSILSSMLHDVENSNITESPDVPTVPAVDLMESYTHFKNVPSSSDIHVDGWDASKPGMGQTLFEPMPGNYSSVPYANGHVGTSMPSSSVLEQTGVNPSSLDKDPVLTTASVPSDSAKPSPMRLGLPVRPDTDPNAELAWKQRVAKVYRDKTEPFRYTEGYHILLKYATQKYETADVLRIVRALAIYRPSLIALQMALSEEDEVFVERAFQRTILEFEKLISFSGTPTVVWRRTCEISLVGTEFCMLTQWSKEDLLGKYIYQFMDKESVLNYWEMFARHAFENTTQSVMTKCVLMTPSGKSIPCTWCFTIKRDPFDLPGFVVGNFLPILS